jgi:hypothetical protein
MRRFVKKLDDGTEIVTITSVPASCVTCIHAAKGGSDACAAFPDGIPYEIRSGQEPHVDPYPGDHGIQYEGLLGEKYPIPYFENPVGYLEDKD